MFFQEMICVSQVVISPWFWLTFLFEDEIKELHLLLLLQLIINVFNNLYTGGFQVSFYWYSPESHSASVQPAQQTSSILTPDEEKTLTTTLNEIFIFCI